jgi:hypothetical protein
MPRGDPNAAAAETSANKMSGVNAGEAAGVFGSLSPFLTTEMTHPAGFDPATMAAMNTGAQQSAGGAAAGAVGQGALRAARTRNRGGANAATEASTRAASQTLSKGLLDVQEANARLRAQQQQEGAGGLERLFGTTTGAGVNSLGEVASNANANTNAANATWDWAKNLFDPLLAAGGSAAPTIGRAFGVGG